MKRPWHLVVVALGLAVIMPRAAPHDRDLEGRLRLEEETETVGCGDSCGGCGGEIVDDERSSVGTQ